MKGISAVGAISLISAVGMQAAHGGFYTGGAVNASFNKATAKVDEKDLGQGVKPAAKDLAARLSKATGEAIACKNAFSRESVEAAKAVSSFVKAAINGLFNENLDNEVRRTIFNLGADAPVTLAILADPRSSGDNQHPHRISSILQILVSKHPGLAQDPRWAAPLTPDTNVEGLFDPSVRALIKAGEVQSLIGLLAVDQNDRDGNIVLAKVQDGNQGSDLTVDQQFIPAAGFAAKAQAAATKYADSKNNVRTLVAIYKGEVKDSTNPNILGIFYQKGDKSKPFTKPAEIVNNLGTFAATVVDNKVKQLGLNDKNMVSKRATTFGFDLCLGYEQKFCDLLLGVEILAGFNFGGKMKIGANKANKSADGIIVRKPWSVKLKPIVGYAVAPNCVLYITGGVEFAKYKVDTKALRIPQDEIDYVNNLTDKFKGAANGQKSSDKAKSNAKANDKVFKSHSKTKAAPFFGLGCQYAITQDLTLFVEYLRTVRSRIVAAKTAGAEVRHESQSVRVGVKVNLN
ncbi:MAG: hypothetical protein LBI20_02455 [Holosporales bacterium]|jgi:opacity protein-like surface antigen|nr:hypothetical protein [Holosporales bacterium]